LIDQMIMQFRRFITDEYEKGNDRGLMANEPSAKSFTTLSKSGAELQEAVFGPLKEAIGNHRRILISPAGGLTQLPFGSLPTNDGKYLTDDYVISYLSAGRDILRFGVGHAGKAEESLVIADPDFDLHVERPKRIFQLRGRHKIESNAEQQKCKALELKQLHIRQSGDLKRSSLRFNRLPGTKEEGKQIAKMLGARLWMGRKAMESKVKAISSPYIFHIATHGFFLPDQKRYPNKEPNESISLSFMGDSITRLSNTQLENPLLRSGLALAGAKTWLEGKNLPAEAEDGLLTAEDVSGMNLLGTELVVLSACDTGLGEVHISEGVFGLRRSFVLAGAKTLVMSLWRVPDLASAILMQRFYYNLVILNLDRSEALRNAQIYIRDVTVGEIKEQWLSKRILKRLSGGNENVMHDLQRLKKSPDNRCPFTECIYWGAYVCQGDIGRLSNNP